MLKPRIIVLIIAVLFANLSAFSQEDQSWIRKPLNFTRTRRSVTVRGIVRADKLVHCYVFKGRKNQRVTAGVVSDNNQSVFSLAEQEGDPGTYTNDGSGGSWVSSYSGILQENSTHEICVSSNRGKSAYTLNVTLN